MCVCIDDMISARTHAPTHANARVHARTHTLSHAYTHTHTHTHRWCLPGAVVNVLGLAEGLVGSYAFVKGDSISRPRI